MNLRKKQILEQLKAGAGSYVSGAELSANFGISRAAVWKHVQELRRDGYTVSAAPRRGYRLEQEPDRLDASALIGAGIHYYPAVGSTNTAARALAEEDAPGGTLVVAETQLKGRGRRGRDWVSPPGKGLWFSFILRPSSITPAAAAPVTLVAAAALARELKRKTGLSFALKWPNDLLLDGKKICGILTELKGEPDRVEYLVVGIGLNVNQVEADFSPKIRPIAGSLRLASGRAYDRTAILLSLAEALGEAFSHFFEHGFSRFHALWKELNMTLGREVTITWPGGEIRGTALDLDQTGALVISDPAGRVHRIHYGEIV